MRTHLRPASALREHEVTPESMYWGRRALLQHWATGAAGLALASWAQRDAQAAVGAGRALTTVRSTVPGAVALDKPTPWKDVTTYNNFYEFGMDKSDPAERSSAFVTDPWTLRVEGWVHKRLTWRLDEVLQLAPREVRL